MAQGSSHDPQKELSTVSRVKNILDYYMVNIVRDREQEVNIYCQCPFHEGTGRSPLNFSINREHGAWCCFANEECGKGSLVQFIMKIEGVDRSKAWHILKTKFRRKTPSWEAIGCAHGFRPRKGEPVVLPVRTWPPELTAIPKNHPWIKKRKYTLEVMREFDVSINRARLDYVFFPVYFEGTLRGFSSRHVGDPGDFKWLHDKTLPRRHVLYGFDRAVERDYVILTEGILDTIRLNTFGYPGAVGVFGAKATDEQIALVIANWNKVIVAFDGDDAGRTGAHHLTQRLKRHVQFVIQIQFHDGIDCDSLDSREEFLAYLGKGSKTQYKGRDRGWGELWS